ncbi:MAG: hypothetical protein OXK80_00230 [Bdellovibrionales bacterium]|nr:hypothetical protein [Bdellovibrionales bacterium]
MMKIILLTLIFSTVPVFSNILDDKATEAEGPGRCAYCDEHTADVDREDDTNPNALTLLHLAQSAEEEAEAKPEVKGRSSEGTR